MLHGLLTPHYHLVTGSVNPELVGRSISGFRYCIGPSAPWLPCGTWTVCDLACVLVMGRFVFGSREVPWAVRVLAAVPVLGRKSLAYVTALGPAPGQAPLQPARDA